MIAPADDGAVALEVAEHQRDAVVLTSDACCSDRLGVVRFRRDNGTNAALFKMTEVIGLVGDKEIQRLLWRIRPTPGRRAASQSEPRMAWAAPQVGPATTKHFTAAWAPMYSRCWISRVSWTALNSGETAICSCR